MDINNGTGSDGDALVIREFSSSGSSITIDNTNTGKGTVVNSWK